MAKVTLKGFSYILVVWFLSPATAWAQPDPQGGTVYRLTEAQKEEILARLDKNRTERESAEKEFGSKLNKAGRISTGVLGFLGYSAAEAAYERRCGTGGAGCVGTEGRYVDSSDVLRR